MKLVPKNWDTFQHYRDRCPPWIKLHRDLLNDRAFITLPTASKALAPMMWLLASESRDGAFDASVEELEFRLRMPAKEIEAGIKALLEKGFFLDASTMLAPSLHDAIPEKSRAEQRQIRGRADKKALPRPENVSEQVWSDFLSQRKQLKADLTVTALEGIKREADKIGWSLEQALVECTVRGWRGFKADWIKEKTDGSSNRTGGVDRRSSLARAIDEGLDLLG